MSDVHMLALSNRPITVSIPICVYSASYTNIHIDFILLSMSMSIISLYSASPRNL